MFKTVQEVRYTNDQKDTLYVLFTDNDDVVQEMYIEPNGQEHKELEALGITDEKIVDATGMFKQQTQRELADIARLAAADVYKDEIEKLKKERDDLKLANVSSKNMIDNNRTLAMRQHAMSKSLDKENKNKIVAVNKYVSDNITQEKIEVAIPNIIDVIKTLNNNKDAIDLVKGESKFKATTLVEALYKTFK